MQAALRKAQAELRRRGFVYSHTGLDREYWTRTDGKPEVFLDHSATISTVVPGHISDFVTKSQSITRKERND